MFDQTTLIPTEELKGFRDRIHQVAKEKIAPHASLVDEDHSSLAGACYKILPGVVEVKQK